MQIQISGHLQKLTGLDLHCLQRQGISGFSSTRVNVYLFIDLFPLDISSCWSVSTWYISHYWSVFIWCVSPYWLVSTWHLTWCRLYSSCVHIAMLHATETWPLTKQNLQCLQQWSDRSAMSSSKTLPHQVQWATFTAWHWRSGPHPKGEKALLIWTYGMLQRCSQISQRHTGWWKAWTWESQNDIETADREGSQRVEALCYWPSL